MKICQKVRNIAKFSEISQLRGSKIFSKKCQNFIGRTKFLKSIFGNTVREFETFSLGEILRENKVCKIKTFLNSYIVDRTGDRFSSTSSCDMTPTRLTAFHIATPPTKYCRTVLSRCVKIEKKKCCSRKDSFQSSTQIIRKVCNSSNFIVSTLEHFQL